MSKHKQNEKKTEKVKSGKLFHDDTQHFSRRKLRGYLDIGLSPAYLFTPRHRPMSPPAAQILLIFGFVHVRVAAWRLLRLKRVSLSATHRVHVCRLLIHLKLSVRLELVRVLELVGIRCINGHHLSCGVAL